MSDRVIINEVALRDGLQSQRVELTVGEKLALAQALVAAGIGAIEAGSFVSPKAVPQMANTDELWPALPEAGSVQYSGLIPNMRGLDRAEAAGVSEVALVLSATDTMNQRNIGMTLSETLVVCKEVIAAARERGLRCKAYVAVAFECPFEGPVAPGTVLQLCGDLMDAGADELVIADTIGAGCPAQVKPLLQTCVSNWGSDHISVHFHDTRSFALANIWACAEAGVRKFDSSLGGLGGCPFAPGAAGNVATEDVVTFLDQCGFRTGIDVPRLLEAIELAEKLVGVQLGGRTTRWLEGRRKSMRSDFF